MTSLEHGDVIRAWRYNPFGPVAMVVLAWYAVRPLLGEARVCLVERWRVVRVLGWIVLVTFVGHGVARAVGIAPDHTGGVRRERSP